MQPVTADPIRSEADRLDQVGERPPERVDRRLLWRRVRRIVAVVAALLHDIGLAELPFSLLAQPTRLTTEQLRTIETHPARGAEIVTRQIPKCGPMSEGIRQHHERLDGTGYPDGSRSIVPLARILAACDVYAAMLAP